VYRNIRYFPLALVGRWFAAYGKIFLAHDTTF